MAARPRPQAGQTFPHGPSYEGRDSAYPATLRGDELALGSPVRALQDAIESEFQTDGPRKPSPLARAAFIVGSCGAFWALVLSLVLKHH